MAHKRSNEDSRWKYTNRKTVQEYNSTAIKRVLHQIQPELSLNSKEKFPVALRQQAAVVQDYNQKYNLQT